MIHTIKLPDIGEGVTEAELVELHVSVGDRVNADDHLADVMTDKATVEIPSPTSGIVRWIGAEVGDTMPVGAEVFKIDLGDEGATTDDVENQTGPDNSSVSTAAPSEPSQPSRSEHQVAESADSDARVLAAPAVRARAEQLGIHLTNITGSGPDGRVTHADLDKAMAGSTTAPTSLSGATNDLRGQRKGDVTETKVIGMRRQIAERMHEAKSRIPHITYIDEIDMTAVEALRQKLNTEHAGHSPRLTPLPFIILGMMKAIESFPVINSLYDDDKEVLKTHASIHVGIATQTDQGLMVPVMQSAETMSLWDMAQLIERLASGAREGKLDRAQLTGSTITVTSLGTLGGLATTPIINKPEVAIVGPNKIQTLPRFDEHGHVVPRKIMNLSSSFDHRIVDGYDAAQFVQRMKVLLEDPAMLFIDDARLP